MISRSTLNRRGRPASHSMTRSRDRNRPKNAERSELAKRWPRDEKGRFVQLDGLTLVDESGDLGKESSRRHFAISAMVVRDPEEIRRIARSYPKDTRKLKSGPTGELKFVSSCKDVRIGVLSDIAGTRPKIYLVDTDKRSGKNKNWPKSGDELYVRSVEELMKMVARNNAGVVGVIFDEHTALKEEDAIRICHEASSSKVRLCCIQPAANSRKQILLQTNDFVPGSIGYELNVRREGKRGPEDYDYFSIIRKFVRRIEK